MPLSTPETADTVAIATDTMISAVQTVRLFGILNRELRP